MCFPIENPFKILKKTTQGLIYYIYVHVICESPFKIVEHVLSCNLHLYTPFNHEDQKTEWPYNSSHRNTKQKST